MEFGIIPEKIALGRCAWCPDEIRDDMEIVLKKSGRFICSIPMNCEILHR